MLSYKISSNTIFFFVEDCLKCEHFSKVLSKVLKTLSPHSQSLKWVVVNQGTLCRCLVLFIFTVLFSRILNFSDVMAIKEKVTCYEDVYDPIQSEKGGNVR